MTTLGYLVNTVTLNGKTGVVKLRAGEPVGDPSTYAAIIAAGGQVADPTDAAVVAAQAVAVQLRVRGQDEGRINDTMLAAYAASKGGRTKARCVVVALPGAYSGSGTGVLTATANGALASQHGVTPAALDLVWLAAGATNITAALDSGLMMVVDPGATGRPYVLARPPQWAHGSVIPVGSTVDVGGEDTLFRGSRWHLEAAKGAVVDTDDPAAYPDKVVIKNVTLASGVHAAFTTVPISPNTGTVDVVYCSTYGVSPDTATVDYGPEAITPGAIGTASVVPAAYAAGMVVNTSDGSHVDVVFLS